MEIIKKAFTPEFRNRLDSIIQFGALQIETIRTVVDKFLVNLQVQLDEKNVQLHVDNKAVDWFVQHGYSESMGARPMARLIQEKLKKALAEDILFGKLAGGGDVKVSASKGEITLKIQARKTKQRRELSDTTKD